MTYQIMFPTFSTLRTQHGYLDVWIGANDTEVNGVVRYEDGTYPMFTFFASTEPGDVTLDCISSDGTGEWYLQNCTWVLSYLCEKNTGEGNQIWPPGMCPSVLQSIIQSINR